MPEQPGNLTVMEVANQLRTSTVTIYRLCEAGKIRHYRIGLGRGKVVIPADAVEDYLREAGSRPPVDSTPFTHLRNGPSSRA